MAGRQGNHARTRVRAATHRGQTLGLNEFTKKEKFLVGNPFSENVFFLHRLVSPQLRINFVI